MNASTGYRTARKCINTHYKNRLQVMKHPESIPGGRHEEFEGLSILTSESRMTSLL